VFELIHLDVVEPLPRPSLSRSKYFVVFTNDYFRKNWQYFLKAKGQVFNKFRVFMERVEKEIPKELKMMQTNKGKEFFSHELQTRTCHFEGYDDLTKAYKVYELEMKKNPHNRRYSI